ncbi:O-antigen ligase family protein [Colwellia sp. MEBiC06753]
MNWQSFLRLAVPWYIATGPIYWFFLLQPSVFNIVKHATALIIIAAPIIFSFHTFYFRSGVIKSSGAFLIVGIIILSLPSLLLNQSQEGFHVLSRYIILLGLLLGFTWSLNDDRLYERLPVAIAIVMVVVCSITIIDWLVVGNLYNFDHQVRLHKSGFSTTRTGWSSGLACCAAFLIWQFLITERKIRYLYLIAFITIIFSQLASGGRGGLLTSVITASLLFIYYGKIRYLMIFAILAMLFSLINSDMLTVHLRLDRLTQASSADFSAGRLDHYTMAFNMINGPLDLLFGFGPHGYKQYFSLQHVSNEIHNVWLRLFIEYGVFLPLFILGYLAYSFLVFYQRHRLQKKVIGILIVLICSLFPTLVEPNAIIFSYQNYLLWWLLFVSLKKNTVENFIKRTS